MKSFFAAGLALCLAACATVPASVHVDAGKALIAAEGGVDAAAAAAQVAVTARLTSPAQDAKIAALTAPCPSGVAITSAIVPQCPVVATIALARAAYAATDTASFATLALNLTALASQLAATHP